MRLAKAPLDAPGTSPDDMPGHRAARRTAAAPRLAALDPERGELAARHVGLAFRVARPFTRAWPRHADDLEGEALLCLCAAARDFDPSRGVKFSTFAYMKIRYGLMKAVNRLQRERAAWDRIREAASAYQHKR